LVAAARAPSARIFAAMIRPPKILWRDLVLMSADYSAGRGAAQRH
jgi:hypothetical protein